MKKERKMVAFGKAEIALSTLVTIILLVLGFVIVLFLYYQIDWVGNMNKEVCHQSVIYRATATEISGAVSSYVPLKCKTDKICVTAGFLGGSCKEFNNAPGVSTVKVKNKEQIEQLIAQNIVDCWNMMGEGRVSLFTQYLAQNYALGKVYPSCVVCTRIAFDKVGLDKAGINLEELDVNRYMMTHAVPDKDISYYKYLVGDSPAKISIQNPSFNDFSEESGNLVISEKATTLDLGITTSKSEFEGSSKDVYSKELGVVFMQISAPKYSKVFTNDLKVLGGAATLSFLGSPAATSKGIGAVARGALSHPVVAITLVVMAGLTQVGSVGYNQAITAGKCGDVMLKGEAQEGCSVVRVLGYNENSLREYCTTIESIP